MTPICHHCGATRLHRGPSLDQTLWTDFGVDSRVFPVHSGACEAAVLERVRGSEIVGQRMPADLMRR